MALLVAAMMSFSMSVSAGQRKHFSKYECRCPRCEQMRRMDARFCQDARFRRDVRFMDCRDRRFCDKCFRDARFRDKRFEDARFRDERFRKGHKGGRYQGRRR